MSTAPIPRPSPPPPQPTGPTHPTPTGPGRDQVPMWLVELPYIGLLLLGLLIYGSAVGVLLGAWAVKS